MPDTTVRKRLLDQRQALLDLGTRNRLINVPMRAKGVAKGTDHRLNPLHKKGVGAMTTAFTERATSAERRIKCDEDEIRSEGSKE